MRSVGSDHTREASINHPFFSGIGKHVLCTLPGGLNMRDTRKMFDAASYYPQLLAAALNPVRFIEPIVKLRNFIKLSAGQVYMVEAKMKSKVRYSMTLKTESAVCLFDLFV